MLFREAEYLAQDPDIKHDHEKIEHLQQVQNTLEINIAKNRHGAKRPVEVHCIAASSTLRNAARPGEEWPA